MPRGLDSPGTGKRPVRPEVAVSSAVDGGADDGVDDTLIHWMLSLTPTERLQWAQDMADTVEALREGREP